MSQGAAGAATARRERHHQQRVRSRTPARACADRLNATLLWVSLEGLGTGEAVAPAIAADLGLRLPAGVDPIEELAGAIDGQRVLLVLDNSEHVVDDCARIAAALLDRCEELRVLVTSRELFGVAGEAILPVRPLAVTL